MINQILNNESAENWETWKNIHRDFTEKLVRQWKNRGLDYEQAKKLIGYSYEPADVEYIDYLREKHHDIDDLLDSLPSEIREKGTINLVYCYSWNNSNEYIVVAGFDKNKDNGKKGAQKKHWRFIDLLICDRIEEEPYCLEIISGHFNREEIKDKFELFKEELEGDNPILALLSLGKGSKGIRLSEVVKDARKLKGINPEKCIKKHDIINIEMDGRAGLEHAAVYLSNREVAHISRRTDQSTNNLKARKDNWTDFLENRKEAEELTLYRPLVPFKLAELIEEHVDISIGTEYGLGEYSLFRRNCEHFATLCVKGVPFSRQVNKLIFLWKSDELEKRKIQRKIEESNREFNDLRKRLLAKQEASQVNRKHATIVLQNQEINLQTQDQQTPQILHQTKLLLP